MTNKITTKSSSKKIQEVIGKFKNVRKIKDTNFPEAILDGFIKRYAETFYRIYFPKELKRVKMKSYFFRDNMIFFNQRGFIVEYYDIDFPCLLVAKDSSIFKKKTMPDVCISKLYDISYIIDTFIKDESTI